MLAEIALGELDTRCNAIVPPLDLADVIEPFSSCSYLGADGDVLVLELDVLGRANTLHQLDVLDEQ